MVKLYLCHHHVRFDSFTALPGEVVEAELGEAAEKRMLKLGALEVVELEGGTKLPEEGESGEKEPDASADAETVPEAAQTAENAKAAEEEDTEAEALAAAAAKACTAETPKRKRSQK